MGGHTTQTAAAIYERKYIVLNICMSKYKYIEGIEKYIFIDEAKNGHMGTHNTDSRT